MKLTTTINRIRKRCPDYELFLTLQRSLPANQDPDEQIDLLYILDKFGIREFLYSLDCIVQRKEIGDKVALQFSIHCALSVIKIFERQYPNDRQPRASIEAAIELLDAKYNKIYKNKNKHFNDNDSNHDYSVRCSENNFNHSANDAWNSATNAFNSIWFIFNNGNRNGMNFFKNSNFSASMAVFAAINILHPIVCSSYTYAAVISDYGDMHRSYEFISKYIEEQKEILRSLLRDD